jgi:hypothetical protein
LYTPTNWNKWGTIGIALGNLLAIDYQGTGDAKKTNKLKCDNAGLAAPAMNMYTFGAGVTVSETTLFDMSATGTRVNSATNTFYLVKKAGLKAVSNINGVTAQFSATDIFGRPTSAPTFTFNLKAGVITDDYPTWTNPAGTLTWK